MQWSGMIWWYIIPYVSARCKRNFRESQKNLAGFYWPAVSTVVGLVQVVQPLVRMAIILWNVSPLLIRLYIIIPYTSA